ncbi:MAG TPA: hypothetical protein VF771_11860 [Longimicrobiaceae bacterium]
MPRTRYRFVVPGFLGGMARVLDLCPAPLTFGQPGLSPAEQDARALAGDWARVGADLRTAMHRVDRELEQARAARNGAR